MNASPRDVVERLYALFDLADVQAMLALMHPDIEWIVHAPNPPVDSGGARHGHIEVTECFIALGAAGIFHEYVIEHLLADGETVVGRGHEHVTHKRTHQTWFLPWVHWWTVRDGLAVKFELFTDSAATEEVYRGL